MRIHERSWHLRYVRWVDHGACFRRWIEGDNPKEDYVPRDLCGYFWAVVGSLVALPYMLLAGGAFWVLCWAVVWTYRLIRLLVVPVVVVGVASYDAVQSLRHRSKERPPNLVVEYLKARKRRICPLIEIVSEDE